MIKVFQVWLCFSCACHARRPVNTVPYAAESESNLPLGTRSVHTSSRRGLAEFLLAFNPATPFRAASPARASALKPSTSFRAAGRARHSPSMLGENQLIQSYEWMANLGAPAALVSGAALASLYELHDDMHPDKNDKRWVSFAKKLGNLLFLSAFALEIACVFVTTVTGTLLLGKGVPNPVAISAMGMLDRELEFEYLFSRVSFFQGLLNWLSGVAVHQIIPEKNSTRSATALRRSHAWAIFTVLMYMVAYYNRHISFYANYGAMLLRLGYLMFERFYHKAFRILPALALIPAGFSIKNAWVSFNGRHDQEEEDA